MKNLLIMRHAKSSWKDDGLPDHERPLNKRGRHDAPRMGRMLRTRGLEPQAILASTAVRARATAAAVAEALAFEGEISLQPGFYSEAPDAYFAALRRLPESVETALIIAHNPGLEDLLAGLTGEEETLSTAAIAHVRLSLASWPDLSPDADGDLVDLWRPRALE
jgi:phosphohistidine phosphatase